MCLINLIIRFTKAIMKAVQKITTTLKSANKVLKATRAISQATNVLQNAVALKKETASPVLVSEKKIAGLTGRLIMERNDIIAAKKLLHDVYIEEGGWKFREDNPTGFKVETIDDVKCLTDNWDDNAYWFGVYHRDELVSCARLLQRNNKGQLDINLYADSQKETVRHLTDSNQSPNMMEAQRCATRPDFRSYGANGIALGMAAAQAYNCGADVIGTTNVEPLKQVLFACEAKEVEANFDYGDGVQTSFLFWAWAGLPKVTKRIDHIVATRIASKQNKN